MVPTSLTEGGHPGDVANGTSTAACGNAPEPAGEDRLLEVARRAGLELVGASSLHLLHRGDDHFHRLLTTVAAAREEVFVEMYQIRPDPVGRELAAALARAARRGVSVRLLLDRFGSARVASWLEPLRAAGVDARWYNPFRPWNAVLRRTHRKLVVVDGAVASVGGVNLAAEFSESASGFGAWRDVALWLEGPVAAALRRQLESAWRAEGGGPVPALPVAGSEQLRCAVAGGVDGRHGHAVAYHALAAAARSELLLVTPYFLPGARLRQALVEAVARGVRVVVVVPRCVDLAWFPHASRTLYGPLLRAGVEIWERLDRMVHAKVAVVDGRLAAVGSVNLNRQSLYSNSETLVLVDEQRLVNQLRSLVLVESAASSEAMCPMRWPGQPDRRRWAELASTAVALVF